MVTDASSRAWVSTQYHKALRRSCPPIPGVSSSAADGCCISPITSYPSWFSSARSQGLSFKSMSFVSMPDSPDKLGPVICNIRDGEHVTFSELPRGTQVREFFGNLRTSEGILTRYGPRTKSGSRGIFQQCSCQIKKMDGDPCRTRTCDNLLRRQVLYPAELRGPVGQTPIRSGSGPQWVQGCIRLKRKLSE